MPNVVFLHPDLGIGGAERLVVDAAVALKTKGHRVRIFTAHHDKTHCFEETRDGTIEVVCVGDWMPNGVFGMGRAVCAYLRMIYVALYLVFASGLKSDVVFCDQVSACLPVVKWFSSARVIFYCHFPDQLLTQRKTLLKKCYRTPIDWLEERTTAMADVILVNSSFTANVFRETFRSIRSTPDVLFPSLNTKQFDAVQNTKEIRSDDQVQFLSINRYERKKNLGLAIKAFAQLRRSVKSEDLPRLKLVMAGGYDSRVLENVEHFAELEALAQDLGLDEGVVTFLKSPSDAEKLTLLRTSHALIYTPSGEHFGIVPIEAMYCEVPVIAVNDGGPTETVVDGGTGYLRSATPDAFAAAMAAIVDGGSDLRKKLGREGRRRVQQKFAFEAFAQQLHNVIMNGK